jgi:hypothetical protein
MPNATVRANARTLPETKSDAAIRERDAAISERVSRRYNQPGLYEKGLETLAKSQDDALAKKDAGPENKIDSEARGATSSADDWRLQIERLFDQAFGDWLRAKAKTFSGDNSDVLEKRVDDEGEAERRLMATPALAPDQFWEKLAAFEAILDGELRANMSHSSILMLGLGSIKADLLNFRLCDREATR